MNVEATGDRWAALRALALRLTEEQTTEMPLSEVAGLQAELRRLIAAGVLVERAGFVRFSHDTLLDHVAARAFVEDDRSLIDEVLRRPQGLFQRPLIRRILVFEREADRERYRTSVRALIENPAVRFHLRDVVFDVLRQDPRPEPADWALITSMVVDEEHENHTASWNVAIQPAFLRVIDRTGTLLRWMISEDERDRNRGTTLLRHLVRDEPTRGAVLMWPFLDLGPEWHGRIRWVLATGAPEDSRHLMELVLTALNAGVYDGPDNNESLWWAVHELPAKRPRWGVELLERYLCRAVRQSPEGNPFGAAIANRSHGAETFIRTLARRAALPFARAVVPIVVDIVVAAARSERGQADPWSLRYSTRGHDVDDALFEALDEALREVSEKQSAAFARLATTLGQQSEHKSLRFLLYRAWAANPNEFWRSAVQHLLDTRDPFVCGYIDSPFWVTRELLHAVQSVAPRRALKTLQERILGFYTDYERSRDGRSFRGSAQLTLLDAFSDRKLSERALRRRDELRRKLGPSDDQAPRGIQAGFVGSPIPEVDARKMSDRSWLSAIRRYHAEERDASELFKGGAPQLARVLEQQTKEEPERFARLALRFLDDVNESYVDAILRGIGEADDDVPVEVVADVLRRFFALPGRPGGRWITKPLARLADKDIPTDILDIVAWYATESPDPERDTWRKLAPDDVEYYGGDPFTSGINSVRGAASEALSVLIWPSGKRLSYLAPTLERLVHDPVVAVRVCAAVPLRSAYQHDRDRAVELFSELTETDDVLLSMRPVEDFLSVATESHLRDLRPTLSRMLQSELADVKAAGGRQIALAALTSDAASDLLEEATSGPPPARLGVAQVAAANVVNEEVGNICVRWLPRFFNDEDHDVRQEASAWVRQLGPTGIRGRHDLALVYIDSVAYLDDESDLLHALDDSTVSVVDVTLRALERFVVHRRREMGDIQRHAAYSAMLASKLAIRAYTSARTTDARDRALDVIDALLAAKVSEVRTFVESFD